MEGCDFQEIDFIDLSFELHQVFTVSCRDGGMKEYDVAIIGGGFAGLACARKAASQGMRTVVLERKADLGSNIRTTGILVKEAADLLHLPEHLGKSIGGVRLSRQTENPSIFVRRVIRLSRQILRA